MQYFSELYSSKDSGREETPILNKWLRKISIERENTNSEDLINLPAICKLVDKQLAKSPSWKAPSIDKIPLAIYKMIPAAKNIAKIQYLQHLYR